MRIGSIAKAAGVTTSRIRFYERRAIIPPAARGPNGYRDYPEDLVALLRFVELAQTLGFTLREIGAVGPASTGHFVSCDAALALLADKLKAVSALIAEAQQRHQRIVALMADLEARKEREPLAIGADCNVQAAASGC